MSVFAMGVLVSRIRSITSSLILAQISLDARGSLNMLVSMDIAMGSVSRRMS